MAHTPSVWSDSEWATEKTFVKQYQKIREKF